jgi:hypothetical protein
VAWYVTEVLGFGVCSKITVSHKTAANGATFRTAVVVIAENDLSRANNKALSAILDDGACQLPAYVDNGVHEFIQFHFDNGKPMMHIKLVTIHTTEAPAATETSVSGESSPAYWMSVYIPVIAPDLSLGDEALVYMDLQTEDGIKRFFEHNIQLGVVKRVDFVTRTLVDSTSTVRSAYVHFETWNANALANHIRDTIDSAGEFILKGHYAGNDFVRFNNRRFMVLKVNRSPIPEANPEANVHQLAARNAELEERVAELEAKLIMFEEMNKLLNEKLGTAQMDALTAEMKCLELGPMTMDELNVETPM